MIIKLGEHAPYSIVKIEINRKKTTEPIDIFYSLPSREGDASGGGGGV